MVDYSAEWYVDEDWEDRIRKERENVFILDGSVSVEVQVAFDRPLRGKTYLFANGFQSAICDAAFKNTGCCVPNQLSALMRYGEPVWPDIEGALDDDVCSDLYASDPESPCTRDGERLNWRAVGVPAAMVIDSASAPTSP